MGTVRICWDYDTTPFECGLGQYVDLDADIESLSLPALRQHVPTKKLMGIIINQTCTISQTDVFIGDQWNGKHDHVGSGSIMIKNIAEGANQYKLPIHYEGKEAGRVKIGCVWEK